MLQLGKNKQGEPRQQHISTCTGTVNDAIVTIKINQDEHRWEETPYSNILRSHYMAVGTTAVTSKATGTSVHPFICQHLNYNILINYLAFYCTKYVLWFYSRVLEDGA